MYKVGAKVRIKSFEAIRSINSEARDSVISFNYGSMKDYCGNVYTLNSIQREKNSEYKYDIWLVDGHSQWIWDERWFEPVDILPEDLFEI